MSYLIEFRFLGSSKKEMKKLIWHIDKKFRIGRAKRVRPVPHISLVGPFYTTHERKLVSDFKKLCESKELMNFEVEG